MTPHLSFTADQKQSDEKLSADGHSAFVHTQDISIHDTNLIDDRYDEFWLPTPTLRIFNPPHDIEHANGGILFLYSESASGQ